ncbi:hypothetical protein AMTRI_Chr07g74770 [Amborella trichopoda]|uniref:Auxin response factor n=1 Tax=Amborella trichopoda TaxID=13333 RepID=W1PEJ1_AMBTC|nr:auxin response factor 18 [Amborella trichopoda]XP_020524326.1 auxin response factor 18 [Amborella trichopoda]XP_020524328.1 auxin response factor 18 [Amborella trichopoda]XP_020524329.1 auxin response factor 18 [Amborella trichopoda]ERN08367.1 hypothetical protein AMTR_s00148p00046020 [Amborella trichopoda]|eukprot:XP_006846786.1 auxin response factor 18 [Amborella trichopoda]
MMGRDSLKDLSAPLREAEKCLDSQLWHACAGGMVQMPPVNSKVFYFPQGHAEHAQGPVDFSKTALRFPPLILCRITSIKFMADPETDEVYAKIHLVPLRSDDFDGMDENNSGVFSNCSGCEVSEKPSSFAKTLTQSDANNGGGFSVPRYCAETIFPRLDYSAHPPIQTVLAKDVHGNTWKFRHIYRGTPRRHLLTTGWSTFVNEKKLVAGDSIVFLRTANGELCMGIRRATRGISGGESQGWSPIPGSCVSHYGLSRLEAKILGVGGSEGFSMFMREEEGRLMRSSSGGIKGGNSNSDGFLRGRNKVSVEAVVEAAALAASGQPFEVVYYPRAGTPEFCVKAGAVKSALRMQWVPGMRFKMAFETEDSSRISWFMGTISIVQVADPVHWPNSPWRLLQVTWDEQDLLQNVKRVNPWLVEVVSTIPSVQLTAFSPAKKKLRLSPHLDFPIDSTFHPLSSNIDPTFASLSSNLNPTPLTSSMPRPTNPFQGLPDYHVPAGIQGARQSQFGVALSNLHLNRPNSTLFLDVLRRPEHVSTELIIGSSSTQDNVSCLLTVGSPSLNYKKSENHKPTPFLLFGKTIHMEPQVSAVESTDGHEEVGSPALTVNSSPEQIRERSELFLEKNELSLDNKREGGKWVEEGNGHCKVFMESEELGRSLDLSAFGSYEELYRKLATWFGIERSETLNHMLYRDESGTVKQTGDEPYSEFMRTARRLTILSDSSSDNMGR